MWENRTGRKRQSCLVIIKVGDMYRILIVDDEKLERNGIQFLLKKTGTELEIFEAANGREMCIRDSSYTVSGKRPGGTGFMEGLLL